MLFAVMYPIVVKQAVQCCNDTDLNDKMPSRCACHDSCTIFKNPHLPSVLLCATISTIVVGWMLWPSVEIFISMSQKFASLLGFKTYVSSTLCPSEDWNQPPVLSSRKNTKHKVEKTFSIAGLDNDVYCN